MGCGTKRFAVAVVGASGAVGEEIIRVLGERKFPVQRLLPLASSRSVGRSVDFCGEKVAIKELTAEIFAKEGVEIAFFSAGGSVSAAFAPAAASAGALVIDNTSHFRMHENIPLVVPEVNPGDIKMWKNAGIIANPNCSTIQMVQVLSPLHRAFGIARVDVSTYQAVSGAGKRGMDALLNETKRLLENLESVVESATSATKTAAKNPTKTTANLGESSEKSAIFPHPIAFNLIPQIDVFLDSDYTKEEVKMIKESAKIMHTDFEISATCVRVPVLRSHSEAITIRFTQKTSAEAVREVLKNAENVVLLDCPSEKKYPMPSVATSTDSTFVGRIRQDYFDERVVHLFCVADQIRVGAATNAIRIAEKWLEMGLGNG